MRGLLAVVAIPLVAVACTGQPGEFDHSGWVAGRVVDVRCSRQGVCAAAPIPKRIWNAPSGTGVRGRSDHQGDMAGIGMGNDGAFGDAPVPEGHWVFFVPRMERATCAPRPAFDVKAKMFYEIVFRYGPAGRCSATVWEQPVGLEHPELRHVVARAGPG
jgi:hypothetical protein